MITCRCSSRSRRIASRTSSSSAVCWYDRLRVPPHLVVDDAVVKLRRLPLRAQVAHAQVVGDAQQPRDERRAPHLVPLDRLPRPQERLRGQVLGLGGVSRPCSRCAGTRARRAGRTARRTPPGRVWIARSTSGVSSFARGTAVLTLTMRRSTPPSCGLPVGIVVRAMPPRCAPVRGLPDVPMRIGSCRVNCLRVGLAASGDLTGRWADGRRCGARTSLAVRELCAWPVGRNARTGLPRALLECLVVECVSLRRRLRRPDPRLVCARRGRRSRLDVAADGAAGGACSRSTFGTGRPQLRRGRPLRQQPELERVLADVERVARLEDHPAAADARRSRSSSAASSCAPSGGRRAPRCAPLRRPSRVVDAHAARALRSRCSPVCRRRCTRCPGRGPLREISSPSGSPMSSCSASSDSSTGGTIGIAPIGRCACRPRHDALLGRDQLRRARRGAALPASRRREREQHDESAGARTDRQRSAGRPPPSTAAAGTSSDEARPASTATLTAPNCTSTRSVCAPSPYAVGSKLNVCGGMTVSCTLTPST